MGYRFRLHVKALPGKPDLVLSRHRTVIFVHGCFWHQHQGCIDCSKPRINADYWSGKLQRNQARDLQHQEALRSLGWKVIVVWECETKKAMNLEKLLREALPANENLKIAGEQL